jgi:hypothetical protein
MHKSKQMKYSADGKFVNRNECNKNNGVVIEKFDNIEDQRCKHIPLTCRNIAEITQCPITCNLMANNIINNNILNNNVLNNNIILPIVEDNLGCWANENICTDDYGNCNMDIVNMCPITCNRCYFGNAQ